MVKSTLNDTLSGLKNTIAGKASSFTGKATICAGSIKNRIDLANEESRQAKRFQILGERVLQAVLDNNFQALKDDPTIVELIGAIQEKKLVIQELESKLAGHKK